MPPASGKGAHSREKAPESDASAGVKADSLLLLQALGASGGGRDRRVDLSEDDSDRSVGDGVQKKSSRERTETSVFKFSTIAKTSQRPSVKEASFKTEEDGDEPKPSASNKPSASKAGGMAVPGLRMHTYSCEYCGVYKHYWKPLFIKHQLACAVRHKVVAAGSADKKVSVQDGARAHATLQNKAHKRMQLCQYCGVYKHYWKPLIIKHQLVCAVRHKFLAEGGTDKKLSDPVKPQRPASRQQAPKLVTRTPKKGASGVASPPGSSVGSISPGAGITLSSSGKQPYTNLRSSCRHCGREFGHMQPKVISCNLGKHEKCCPHRPNRPDGVVLASPKTKLSSAISKAKALSMGKVISSKALSLGKAGAPKALPPKVPLKVISAKSVIATKSPPLPAEDMELEVGVGELWDCASTGILEGKMKLVEKKRKLAELELERAKAEYEEACLQRDLILSRRH